MADRREFMKITARTFAAGLVSYSLVLRMPRLAKGIVPASGAPIEDFEEHLCSFVVDTTKCIGCGSCVRSCRSENHVPDRYYRTWVERYTDSEDQSLFVDSPSGGEHGFLSAPRIKGRNPKAFFVPKLCNQCEKPTCTQVCPVSATYHTPGGVVLVDQDRCIGCGYCVQACPYEARYIDHATGTADKCTWCYHRITSRLSPACVLNCPTGARSFTTHVHGKPSTACELLKTERYDVLKEELGTNTQVYYLGFNREVR